MAEASPKNDKQKPSLDFTVPDFNLPPRHADVTIADAIEECIRELQQQRESFFTNLKQTLDRDFALRTNFFKAMEDSSHIKIWAELKTRFQLSASVAKAPPLTRAQNRISFQQILKEPVVTPADEHERILQIIEADWQEDAELAWRRIQDMATERSIRYLVHFTRVGNLSSIMSHGLLSVQAAHKQGLVPLANDQLRLDGRTDAISLSISFPNDAMFYKYRQLHPQERWVVLLLSPEILWTRSCAFCRHNAADRRIRSRPWSELTTSEAFQSMFAEALDGTPTRAAQGLGLSDPTDIQAEMLVQSYIHPSKVIQMVFEHPDDLQAHRHHTVGRHARVQVQGSDVFATRRFLRKTGSVA